MRVRHFAVRPYLTGKEQGYRDKVAKCGAGEGWVACGLHKLTPDRTAANKCGENTQTLEPWVVFQMRTHARAL